MKHLEQMSQPLPTSIRLLANLCIGPGMRINNNAVAIPSNDLGKQ